MLDEAVRVGGSACALCRVGLHFGAFAEGCGGHRSVFFYIVETFFWGGGTHVMHGRSGMTIDPRIPSMSGRSTSGFHRPGTPSPKRRKVLGESHEG